MYRFLLVLFIALCAAQPTWVKRMGIAKRFGISNPLGDGSLTSTTTTSSTTTSTTTTTGSGSTTSPIIVTTGSGSTSTMYEIFALGGGSCKQGFIGQVNTAACWSSTCGIWTALKIRQLNNATITMFSTSACTGDAEKIYPVNPVGNVEQDCAFATHEFQSFRVIPGGVTVTNADQASLNPICQGGLTEIDCSSATSTCLGTVLT